MNDMPSVRNSATGWFDGQNIYIFGGIDEIIGTDKKPSARGHATSWHDGNYAYVFGGWKSNFKYINDLWRYDATHNTWEEIIVDGDKPSARDNVTSWYDDKYGYLFGGYGADEDGNGNYLNDIWRFDGMKWEQIKLNKEEHVMDIMIDKPSARSAATNWHDERFYSYIFGGHNGGNYLNDLWRFDETQNIWEEIIVTGDKPPARAHATSWHDGTFYAYVFGGCGVEEYGKYFNDTWRYDAIKNIWEEIIVTGDKPPARAHATSWYDGTNAYVFGGYGADEDGNGNYLNDIWRFDGVKWEEIK